MVQNTVSDQAAAHSGGAVFQAGSGSEGQGAGEGGEEGGWHQAGRFVWICQRLLERVQDICVIACDCWQRQGSSFSWHSRLTLQGLVFVQLQFGNVQLKFILTC